MESRCTFRHTQFSQGIWQLGSGSGITSNIRQMVHYLATHHTSSPEVQDLRVNRVVVPTTLDRRPGKNCVDLLDLSRSKLDIPSCNVLQVALLVAAVKEGSEYASPQQQHDLRGARDRDDVIAERGDPCEGQLARSYSLLLCDGLHALDKSHVVVEHVLMETSETVTHISS